MYFLLHVLYMSCKTDRIFWPYPSKKCCLLSPVPVGYMRCGDDSAQCISENSQCDGINDCLNGWDEQMSLCLTEDRITNRLVERTRMWIKFLMLITEEQKYCFILCILLAGEFTFNFHGLPSRSTYRIFRENGDSFDVQSASSAKTNIPMEDTCMFAVELISVSTYNVRVIMLVAKVSSVYTVKL